jgi:hypothetical protein
VILALAPCARAAVPEGVQAGPWLLAPYLSTSFEGSDNVFYDSRENPRRTGDYITTLGGGIEANLPFSNSNLMLKYDAKQLNFQTVEFPRDLRQLGQIDLELNFKTGDTLSFKDTFRKDFTAIDIGSEQPQFTGEPYNLNSWEIELARNDIARQGYLIRVRRQDFNHEGTEPVNFFEYRGFDNAFEYRQPMPNRRSWVARYESRRFNHYVPQASGGVVGVPFRKELSDSILFGVRGLLGRDQPYFIRLGFGRFRYQSQNPSRIQGVVGSAARRLVIGGRSTLDLYAVRRPLPSNSADQYVNNGVRAIFERQWLHFESGTEAEVVFNNYDGPGGGNCGASGDDDRQEKIFHVEAYGGWRVHRRMRFKVSGFYDTRSSNCVNFDYDVLGFETGLALGWF